MNEQYLSLGNPKTGKRDTFYRFYTFGDLKALCSRLKAIYTNYDSMEAVFSVEKAANPLNKLQELFAGIRGIPMMDGNSACKRLAMFLRWMVRCDGIVDFGLWTHSINPSELIIPLDTHGDASIGDALVQLGQKDLLIDCQGNWGNILTGDSAAAPRYIEARLSKFALETVFNPKTTLWQLSYDGRNREPVTLPVKFPLLLAQGVEGIAVGLSSKILPHNFNELLDASIAYLKGEPFTLYPDFQTGGFVDVSKYNDGERGGMNPQDTVRIQ